MHLCTLVFIYSYIVIYIHIPLYHLYHNLTILVLSIFLSCMLLLIHISILIQVLIPMLCHLLLISIVLIIYAFLPCVPSMFPFIPFGMCIIYFYHLRISIMSLSIHIHFVSFIIYFLYLNTCHILFYIRHIFIFFSCSSMNLLYLIIGIIPIDSSKFKLWHFHAD